jgi:regulatory protein YycI of two-component signal transduction system YycFG
MDWAKAKTILIIAFVITNIFLAYNVWNTKYYGHRSERISDDRIEELVDILQQRGMRVSAPIPKDLYTKEILTVEYMEIDTDGLMETVFGREGINPVVQGDSVRHSERGIVL